MRNHISHERTTRFSGRCEKCIYPVVVELPEIPGDYTHASCPGCYAEVKLERLFGVYSNTNCDSRCQYALGPVCECACGGANHQKGYLPLVKFGEISASLLEKYRKTHAKRQEAGRKRSEAAKAKKAAAFQAQINEFFKGNPQLVRVLSKDEPENADEMLREMREAVAWERDALYRYGNLFDYKVEKVTRVCQAIKDKYNRPAEKLVKAPIGRVSFEGIIVSEKWVPNEYSYNGGEIRKLIVKVAEAEGNWLCYLTCPKALSGAEKGDRVALTATLKPGRDAHFCFGSRPTGSLLENKSDDRKDALA